MYSRNYNKKSISFRLCDVARCINRTKEACHGSGNHAAHLTRALSVGGERDREGREAAVACVMGAAARLTHLITSFPRHQVSLVDWLS